MAFANDSPPAESSHSLASRRVSTQINVSAEDWARTKFVRSLLWETMQAVRTIVHPRQQLHHRSWLDTVDVGLARRRLPVLLALNPRAGWIPDFLAPPPRTGSRHIEDELAEVATYPLTAVATDLRRSLLSRPTRGRQAVLAPLLEDPELALAAVLDELQWAWASLLAPFWPQVCELIDADIAHRSRQIGRAGLGRVVASLHPDVSAEGGAILVRRDKGLDDESDLELGGQGLALMPSAFAWPDVVVAHDPPWPPTLIYPARGVGDLWTAPSAPSAGLAGVLGATRAGLLIDLARPRTTTGLAARQQLSAAAVSGQLALLRDAGLITSRRAGKEVQYRRTAAADALIAAAGHRNRSD